MYQKLTTAALLLAVTLASSALFPKYADGASISARSKIATITEVISASGNSSISGSIGDAVNLGGVTTTSGASQTVANLGGMVTAISSPQSLTFSTPQSASSTISQVVQYGMGQFAPQVAALMRSGQPLAGADEAAFTYTAPVTIAAAGGSTKGFVNDTCFITPSASFHCVGGRYTSNVTKIIYAVYQQGAVAQGLPKNWTLPNPGGFEWSVLEVQESGAGATQSFLKINGSIWHKISFLHSSTTFPLGSYGSYDMFQVGKVGSNTVLFNCSAVSQGSCATYQAGQYVADPGGQLTYNPQDPVNLLAREQVVPLESKYGATGAVLLYGATVAPVYSPGPNGTRVAETAVDIQQRVIIPGNRLFFIAKGAGAHFNEQGYYGYLLDEEMYQYNIDPAGKAVLSNTYSRHIVSPTESFSKSVALGNGAKPSGPDIINPFKTGNQIYSYLDDTVNHLPASAYVHVAPIVTE